MEVKNQKKAWLYLLPVLIVLAVFTFYPIIMSFVWAFLEGYRLNTPISGVGIQNFIEIFKAEDVIIGNNFLRALQNTAIIAFVTVPCSTILALLISVALNSIKPLQKALQTIYFLPYITNTLAIGAVFALIFSNPTQTSGGIVNDILKMIFKEYKHIIPYKYVSFINVYPALCNKKGEPIESYYQDGLHINDEGYLHYSQAIKKYL